MADFAELVNLKGRVSPLPPFAAKMRTGEDVDYSFEPGEGPQPISAFVCIIDYEGETRPITCRRYEVIGDAAYVGAICHAARGYRRFSCSKIEQVFDSATGEAIGDGKFFERFSVDVRRDRAPTWGLSSSRKSTLVAGLNILAFMARCDGHWHPLETEVIESFVCSMWLRKEWDGDPPIEEIVAHSQRLAPDSSTFFAALKSYAISETSSRIIRQAIGDLIVADGIIRESEMHWGSEVDAFFTRYSEEMFRHYFVD